MSKNTYYEIKGNPDSPALVFLHGSFGNIETFNAVAPQLNDSPLLIGIDSRGQGKSTLGTLQLTYKRIGHGRQAIRPAPSMYADVTAASWRQMFPQSFDSYQAQNPEPVVSQQARRFRWRGFRFE
ncbi:TPA: alpha/beta fold hydrolase [Klebsiella oxytoca]